MEWRSPPGEGVLQHRAASSSSCRRLQEATCRAENLAGLSHFCDDQTNRDHKARPGRTEQNRNPCAHLVSLPTPRQARLGSAQEGSPVCANPASHLDIFFPPSARRPCFLATFQDREAGRCHPGCCIDFIAVLPANSAGVALYVLYYRQMRKAITSFRQCLRIDPNSVTY